MDLECRSSSSDVELQRNGFTNGCGSSKVQAKHVNRRRCAIRDFPIGCGPPRRVFTKALSDLDQLETFGAIVPTGQKEIDTESLKNEQIEELSEDKNNVKDSVMREVKASRPRQRISAIRYFPPGCGRETLHATQEISSKPHVFGTNEFGIMDKNEEAIRTVNFGSIYDKNILQKDSKYLGEVKGKQQENGSVNVLEKVKAPCDVKVSLPRMIEPAKMASAKYMGTDVRKKRQDIGQHSLDSTICLELISSPQGIVQAIMASTECPWRQSKRAIKRTES